MTNSLSHCFLTVHDYDEALRFYRDVVGLEVRNDVTFEDNRWLTLGAPDQPGVEIGFMIPGYFPHTSGADRQATADLLAKGLLPGIIFRTGNCDETFEKIRATGAEVLQEPVDQPYGVRDCAFRDPSGNMVRFSERAA
ncbi:VOC family protein [Jidongwangia harbinensis]|uniref:VOC family protein n=1 Tax=Jidongwangia harbinensis TaxID=2878561 RepID=UPI001CD9A406|nr:VOC family protein [Jidongwangia harbinensis]MCA2213334.1 VOC family protein [Jidongwangia harbinensis]